MDEQNFYLVGGGIASLSCAVFLIRDGRVPGKNIRLFEETGALGGSLDGSGSPEDGYVIRGGRMLNFKTFECTWDLLGSIPSPGDPKRTMLDEIVEFNKNGRTCSRSRLVDANRQKVNAAAPGLSWRDRFDLLRLSALSETAIGNRRIEDHFTPAFFKTNFWYLWATTFAFQPWHSAAEFQRYADRFIHIFPRFHTLEDVDRTPYNQYDALILPIVKWLEGQGVRFKMETRVTGIDLKAGENTKTVERIHCVRRGESSEIAVTPEDRVFVTIGSMTADSSLGTMTQAPRLETGKTDGAWTLWKSLAKEHPDLGRPAVFSGHLDGSWWESFTVTLRDPVFFRKMEKFTGNATGTGGLVTFKDSNWLMSVVLPRQPHFLSQPPNVQILWGYGLFPGKTGNYVDKKMSDCTGEEILTELCGHLGFESDLPLLRAASTVIPCLMPYITSQFLARQPGDRPPVVQKGYPNLALLGQFCEVPGDTVFTVEYSVRSAQTAVYSLLKLDKKVQPIYKGKHHIGVLWNALRTVLK
jgi:oleate hydratase